MKNNLKILLDNLKLNYRFACKKLGIPGYEVHQIYLPEQSLLYIPIPKNACTSIKHALYEIEFGKRFTPEFRDSHGYDDHHDYYKKRTNAFTSVEKLESMDSVTRFALVRDPVKRLLSCYRNRVVDLGDLYSDEGAIRQLGLPIEPDVNAFFLNINRYRKASKLIEHHARPQSHYLGGTISYLDHLYPLEDIEHLQEMLKGYKPHLELLQRKSGGTTVTLEEVSEEALEAAITFYRQDYQLLQPLYSPQKIRQDYTVSRSA